MSRVFACLFVLNLVVTFGLTDSGETTYNIYETPETIIANGYPAERHKVVTEDGYILEIHRIPHGKEQDEGPSKSVVFLMHGFLSASNDFIALGPEYGVAYNYADAGYDVWMGNARGTKNSRNHTTLNPDDPKEKLKFFDFTYEEIGTGDVTASVDYILNVTGQKNMHYIGHSQGGTVFFALIALKPEYNEKFKSAHILAGVGYQDFFPNKMLKGLALFTDIIYNIALGLGIVELYPPASKTTAEETAADAGAEETEGINPHELCTGDRDLKHICNSLGLSEVVNKTKTSEMGGASLKQLAHYGQNIRDRVFKRYNHGKLKNLKVYGQTVPPTYKLELITVNVTMHYTSADDLLDEQDVFNMVRDMPNAQARRVAKDDFKHGDFVASEDAKSLVTEYIIHAMHTIDLPNSSNNILGVNKSSVADSATSIFFDQIITYALILYSISYWL